MNRVMTHETISFVFPPLNKTSNMLIYIAMSLYLEFCQYDPTTDYTSKTAICPFVKIMAFWEL